VADGVSAVVVVGMVAVWRHVVVVPVARRQIVERRLGVVAKRQVAERRLVVVVVGVAGRQVAERRRRLSRDCSLCCKFPKRKGRRISSVYFHWWYRRGTFAWSKPASRRMVSLRFFMAEARLAAHETVVCWHVHMAEARLAAQMVRSFHGVARRFLGRFAADRRSFDRQVVRIFRYGSTGQNKGLINRIKEVMIGKHTPKR
jgi:hypothetical protein